MEALDVIENFVETVESTLPREATIVKTIGDEVMVVSPDAASLTEWAVELPALAFPQRPQPRVGIHCGEAVYRDGDYFGSQVNLAHRVVNRALAGEVLVTDRVAEAIEAREGLDLEPIGQVSLKGFPVPTDALRRPRRRAERPPNSAHGRRPDARAGARRGAGRPWRPGRGDALRGRDSVCMLDLAVRGARRRDAVTALHVNYGLRDDSDADERHCAELCERLGVGLEIERPRRPGGPRQPAGLGPRQPLRGRRRARPAPGGDDRHRPHRRRPGRDDPLPARLLAQPPRPAGDAPARRHAWRGRCSAAPGPRSPPTASSAVSPGARTPPTPSTAFARNRVRHGLLPELDEIHPAAAAERAAHGGAAARRGARCSTLWSTPRSAARPARLAARSPWRGWRSCRRRCAASSSSGWPIGAAGRPVPGAARFAEQVAGLRRTGTRDARSRQRRARGRRVRRPPGRAGLSRAMGRKRPQYGRFRPVGGASLYLDCGG